MVYTTVCAVTIMWKCKSKKPYDAIHTVSLIETYSAKNKWWARPLQNKKRKKEKVSSNRKMEDTFLFYYVQDCTRPVRWHPCSILFLLFYHVSIKYARGHNRWIAINSFIGQTIFIALHREWDDKNLYNVISYTLS